MSPAAKATRATHFYRSPLCPVVFTQNSELTTQSSEGAEELESRGAEEVTKEEVTPD